FLLPQDLAAWNVGRDHVEVIALTNLALMFRNGMKFTGLETDKNGRPRMLMLSYVDPRPYGAALMLLPEVWAWLEEMLEDVPVVGVPERGSLIAAGQQAQLLGRLRHDVQERHREAAIPVSDHLFCVENGRIREYARWLGWRPGAGTRRSRHRVAEGEWRSDAAVGRTGCAWRP